MHSGIFSSFHLPVYSLLALLFQAPHSGHSSKLPSSKSSELKPDIPTPEVESNLKPSVVRHSRSLRFSFCFLFVGNISLNFEPNIVFACPTSNEIFLVSDYIKIY